MPNPEIAITIHSPPHSPTSTEDFELVRHPNHTPSDWKPSHRQEELPYYMAEDTSTRRRVTHHHPVGVTTQQHDSDWADEYDGEGKDVYAKANVYPRYGGGGRIARKGPPPPPTSFVRVAAVSSHLSAYLRCLLQSHSASLSSKISITSHLRRIPSCRAGRGSIKLANHPSSFGTRHTLASLLRTTSSASFTSMSTRRSGRCSWGLQVCCQGTTAALSLRAARPTPTACRTSPCVS